MSKFEHIVEKISQEEVVVLGICRNVENDLESDVLRIVEAFKDFKRVHFRLVESDSTDCTLNVLANLSERFSDFKYVSLGSLESEIPSRVQRIAHCRNVCVELLHIDQELVQANYVVVSDLDGVNPLLTRNGVLSCWEREDWDVCTANQAAPYYDIFALRHPSWSPDNCWKYEWQLLQGGMNPISAREKAVYSRQKLIPFNSPWIHVDSAFGGFAIYRRECFTDAKYSALLENGEEECEHVVLHHQLTERGYKIYINPMLINVGWNPHNYSQLTRNRIKRFIKRVAFISIWKFRRVM